MCLIAFAWSCHPRFALALIANRDEFHGRPSAPATAPEGDDEIIGGIDLQAGGSWLQLSRRGRLAAVTNVRSGSAPPASPRSRGGLVSGFVAASSHCADFAEGLLPLAAEYGRHTLLLWDGASFWQSTNHPRPQAMPVKAGVHALSNAWLDAPWPKSVRAAGALRNWLASDAAATDAPDCEALFGALADTTIVPDDRLPDTGVPLLWERRLSATFITGADYGTRCSTVVLVGHDGQLWFEERRFGPQGSALGTTRWCGSRVGGDAAVGAASR